MITHPVRDRVAGALAKAGLDSTTILYLLDDLHHEVLDNDTRLRYPQGRQYLVEVLNSMQSGTKLSSVEATATEAVVQISGWARRAALAEAADRA